MRTILTALIALSFLTGCVGVTPEGEGVRVVNDSRMVDGCEYLAQASSGSLWGGIAARGLAEDNTTADLRNQAARAGGDTLLLVSSRIGMSGTRMTGYVYRCRR